MKVPGMKSDKRRNLAPDLSRKGIGRGLRKGDAELEDKVFVIDHGLVTDPRYEEEVRKLKRALRQGEPETLQNTSVSLTVRGFTKMVAVIDSLSEIESVEVDGESVSKYAAHRRLTYIRENHMVTPAIAASIRKAIEYQERKERGKRERAERKALAQERKEEQERMDVYGDELGSF